MAEQEQQITADALDMPVPGRSRTGRAVALARLLHQECAHLLQLYVSITLHAHSTNNSRPVLAVQ